MLAHALLSLLVFEHVFIQIRYRIFDFFWYCFMSNKYFLRLLNFTRYIFSVNNFLLMKNVRNECWVLSISWNYFMFHETTLKPYFMKCPERKILQCILPFSLFLKNRYSEYTWIQWIFFPEPCILTLYKFKSIWLSQIWNRAFLISINFIFSPGFLQTVL